MVHMGDFFGWNTSIVFLWIGNDHWDHSGSPPYGGILAPLAQNQAQKRAKSSVTDFLALDWVG